mmetsp:Transcript_211/g.194  ORF Transcript_211/g.194 Transcript_211/m.194 type:complete len:113 (+) Transcript_211:193-531(+)
MSLSFPWVGLSGLSYNDLSVQRQNDYITHLNNIEHFIIKKRDDIRLYKPSLQPIGLKGVEMKSEVVGINHATDNVSIISEGIEGNIDMDDERVTDDGTEDDMNDDDIQFSPN